MVICQIDVIDHICNKHMYISKCRLTLNLVHLKERAKTIQ